VTVSVLNADSGRLPPAVRTTTTAFDVRSSGFFCGRPGGLELVIAKFHYTDPHGLCRRPARTQWSFAAKKSVRVRVGSVSGPCSGI